MKIITNNHLRDLLSLADLTKEEVQEFDYIKEEEEEFYQPRIVRYKGALYDTHEFISTRAGQRQGNDALNAWDGYHADSYFSAVLLKWDEDFERVKAGTAFS